MRSRGRAGARSERPRRGLRPAVAERLHVARTAVLARGGRARGGGPGGRGARARHALRGGRLRRLLLLAPPRHQSRTDVPPRLRAAPAQLAPPSGRLPRTIGHGCGERSARAPSVRAAPRAGVRPHPAARHRARGRLCDRRAEHDGRAGPDRASTRPRVRHGPRKRLVGAGHPGLGVPAARPLPGQVVRHVDLSVGGPLERARRAAGGGRRAGARAPSLPAGGAVGVRHRPRGGTQRRADRPQQHAASVLVDRAADCPPDRERGLAANGRPARHGHHLRPRARRAGQPDRAVVERRAADRALRRLEPDVSGGRRRGGAARRAAGRGARPDRAGPRGR